MVEKWGLPLTLVQWASTGELTQLTQVASSPIQHLLLRLANQMRFNVEVVFGLMTAEVIGVKSSRIPILEAIEGELIY